MRSLIAVLALVAGLSFGGAFWMVYEGYSVDDRATPAAPAVSFTVISNGVMVEGSDCDECMMDEMAACIRLRGVRHPAGARSA
jgi:hypothetical protein